MLLFANSWATKWWAPEVRAKKPWVIFYSSSIKCDEKWSRENGFVLTFNVTKHRGTKIWNAKLEGSFCQKQGQGSKNVILSKSLVCEYSAWKKRAPVLRSNFNTSSNPYSRQSLKRAEASILAYEHTKLYFTSLRAPQARAKKIWAICSPFFLKMRWESASKGMFSTFFLAQSMTGSETQWSVFQVAGFVCWIPSMCWKPWGLINLKKKHRSYSQVKLVKFFRHRRAVHEKKTSFSSKILFARVWEWKTPVW